MKEVLIFLTGFIAGGIMGFIFLALLLAVNDKEE